MPIDVPIDICRPPAVEEQRQISPGERVNVAPDAAIYFKLHDTLYVISASYLISPPHFWQLGCLNLAGSLAFAFWISDISPAPVPMFLKPYLTSEHLDSKRSPSDFIIKTIKFWHSPASAANYAETAFHNIETRFNREASKYPLLDQYRSGITIFYMTRLKNYTVVIDPMNQIKNTDNPLAKIHVSQSKLGWSAILVVPEQALMRLDDVLAALDAFISRAKLN